MILVIYKQLTKLLTYLGKNKERGLIYRVVEVYNSVVWTFFEPGLGQGP